MGKTRVTLTPAQISEKWRNNTSGATQAYANGVKAVTESPMEKAAANGQKALAGYTNAINSGKWAKTLRDVTLAAWQAVTADKGAARLSSGVQAAMPKRQKFDVALVNHLNSILPQINSMNVVTIEDSINKAAAMIRAMAGFQYKTTG